MNSEELLLFAKNHKRMLMDITKTGDIPPTVVAMRKGQILATITAPQIDKMLGLKAAALCREGLNADALLMIFDSHIAHLDMPPGISAEEAEKVAREQYPSGSMQRMCDEEGACAAGKISDCLVCQYHSETEFWMVTLLYDYKDESKQELIWTESQKEQKQVDGFIFQSMKRILESPKGIEIDGMKRMRDVLKLTEEDTYKHMGRAAVQSLIDLQYVVIVAIDHQEIIPAGCGSRSFSIPQYEQYEQ